MTDNERLKKVIYWLISQGYALSQEDLASKLGHNKTYLSQIVTGNKPMSIKFVKNITELFPKVNSEYLMSGEGKMITDDLKATNNLGTPLINDCLQCAELEKRIEDLTREIKNREHTIEVQDKLIAEYEMQLGKKGGAYCG